MKNNKKGAILFIVLAVIILVVILSGVILSIVSSQSRLTHHQVSRIKAYYAGKGMMNYALEKLRIGEWAPHSSQTRYACHRGCIDAPSITYPIPTDNDIPYKVQVAIRPLNRALGNTVTQLEIKTQYTDSF
jgi:Tfp pilus assembly protein PilX